MQDRYAMAVLPKDSVHIRALLPQAKNTGAAAYLPICAAALFCVLLQSARDFNIILMFM